MPAAVTVALAGDTMLGRLVAEAFERVPIDAFVAPEVVTALRAADLRILNLECCISRRGRRWPDPAKPFFFRAPPAAVALLRHLDVDVVTLANNHALDYGRTALADTLAHLHDAGIRSVGAGRDLATARRPLELTVAGQPLTVVALTDHPADFAAGPHRAGVAHADLRTGLPAWVTDAVADAAARGRHVLVTPHWGPNMVPGPTPHVRRAAGGLLAAGATVVAGHSAHVVHGVGWPSRPGRAVLYDLGDFLDDYAAHPWLRNDLGLLWSVRLTAAGVDRVAALPLRLRLARTELAAGADRRWLVGRLTEACGHAGTDVHDEDGWLVLVPGGHRLPGAVPGGR
jgi:poly-gamma-glutamate capsule biosynthesis protein CapA/YwtB (metallophosphatase superfamily)